MLDFDKPIQTKSGKSVRILCTDGPEPGRPIVGIIEGDKRCRSWGILGKKYSDKVLDDSLDLVNPPEKIELFVVFYKHAQHPQKLYSASFIGKEKTEEFVSHLFRVKDYVSVQVEEISVKMNI